jgi:hypothetical protein
VTADGFLVQAALKTDVFEYFSLYKHKHPPLLFTSTLKMEVVCASETEATLPTYIRYKDSRAELTSIMRNCINVSHFKGNIKSNPIYN